MSSTATLIKALARFDETAVADERDALRPRATPAQIETAETAVGVPFPAALRALYAWRDGEIAGSKVFHNMLASKFETLWAGYYDKPLQIRFMTLKEVARVGVTDVWIHPDGGEVLRSEPEDVEAEPSVFVPFLWIHAPDDSPEREVSSDDWFLAVDATRGAVWLYEVGNEALEGVFEEAPSLSAWFEALTKRVALTQKEAKKAAAPLSLESPAVLCLRFMLDRKLIELEEGADVATVAAGIKPLLALKPPKRAVRAVLDHLSEDGAIAEVFAEDDLLAKIVIEFVD